ncbi:hypothetical protein [Enterovibrio norvegicus]|uniref:hypothetical protein n=1 Tax=Enterovibrio norvegicus TaxID=188144 RepID=UPI0010BE78F9|nr:hypothetical protein [Enterovibrio norvegicus]TKF30077.1 hypothetical protein FCV83_19975 [Enterovibrio norvegicus]
MSPVKVVPLADDVYLENLNIDILQYAQVLDFQSSSNAFTRYCHFWNATVDSQPVDGKTYDVIHIGINELEQSSFSDVLALVDHALAPNGVLVFGGLISQEGNAWKSIDDHYVPSFGAIKSHLSDHAWKLIGSLEGQASLPRSHYMFFHVSRMKPTAFLLLGSPGAGKSTIARRYFKALPVVQGDQIYKAIADGRIEVSVALYDAVSKEFDSCRILRMTVLLFEQGLGDEIVDVWLQHAKHSDVVVDSYVPPKYHKVVKARFTRSGYVAIDLQWDMAKTMCSKRRASELVGSFMSGKKTRSNSSQSPIQVDTKPVLRRSAFVATFRRLFSR